ncbi:MAG TPA: FliG C-terminal domain-containing protein [Bdellovibrionota bacterium]|jgi:flagellar motor switch protein FliG|nr:FliG C-terminal domain-containing protein [Bdellovibrionota bacterium]
MKTELRTDFSLRKIVLACAALAMAAIALATISRTASAANSAVDKAKQVAENQVRSLVEPLLEKYCNEHCKILNIEPAVDAVVPDTIAPGFDESIQSKSLDIAASSVKLKLLVDELVGPVSRGKVLDLIQQHLDALAYPVTIDTKVLRFPQPASSSRKVAELREKVTQDVQHNLTELFARYCPDRCLLSDLQIDLDPVNLEEAQYGSTGEFLQDGDTAVHVRHIGAKILMDAGMFPDERASILEMAKLRNAMYKNVDVDGSSVQFPSPERMADFRAKMASGRGPASVGGSSDSSSLTKDARARYLDQRSLSSLERNQSQTSNTNNSNNSSSDNSNRTEKFEHFEKIERVESGDAVQAELGKFKVYGLIFACAILSLLIFLALAAYRPAGHGSDLSPVQRIFQNLITDPLGGNARAEAAGGGGGGGDDRASRVKLRYEIENLTEELSKVYAEQPKVAKQVFSRILTEEGVEATAQYIEIFGEAIVVDMLRDPSLQRDVTELMEFYARNNISLAEEEKLDLLRALHNITVASKLYVMGNRSTALFDFLVDMDDMQVMELVRNESLTVKAIVLTQCDPQKRDAVYRKLDDGTRMSILTELSRIDHLPKDYISNVATALKRKRHENPRLNTEALPGTDVLVSLLEKTGMDVQRSVVSHLDNSNPDSAHAVKNKLISLETLRYLRDQHLLEVVLSLRHDELLQFLKGTNAEIRQMIFSKCPRDLVAELEEELEAVQAQSRDGYAGIERKILNRIKKMATDGKINLVETNERMFSGTGFEGTAPNAFQAAPPPPAAEGGTLAKIKKVAGW